MKLEQRKYNPQLLLSNFKIKGLQKCSVQVQDKQTHLQSGSASPSLATAAPKIHTNERITRCQKRSISERATLTADTMGFPATNELKNHNYSKAYLLPNLQISHPQSRRSSEGRLGEIWEEGSNGAWEYAGFSPVPSFISLIIILLLFYLRADEQCLRTPARTHPRIARVHVGPTIFAVAELGIKWAMVVAYEQIAVFSPVEEHERTRGEFFLISDLALILEERFSNLSLIKAATTTFLTIA